MNRHTARPVSAIGVASGIGAQDHGCADGPDTLRGLEVFRAHGRPVEWGAMLHPAPNETPLVATAELCGRLAGEVERTLEQGGFPLVVGGDHSCAIGTWGGVRRWLGERGALGLIWLDAHMDSHTFATSPSRALHGMPLACLLGHGAPELTGVAGTQPELRPEHVCLIGIRSYEEGEAALLARLGVRVIGIDEVRRRGLDAVLAEARAIASNGTAGYGVTLDLDVLDPAEEPGVGSPAPDGMHCAALARALRQLRGDAALLALEIVEYNPHRDRGQRTAIAAGELFGAMYE